MDCRPRRPGKTPVTPDVLIALARMASLNVEGVSRMAPVSGGVNRFFRRGINDGVQIRISENTLAADIYLVVEEGFNIRDVARNGQRQVARPLQKTVSMA